MINSVWQPPVIEARVTNRWRRSVPFWSADKITCYPRVAKNMLNLTLTADTRPNAVENAPSAWTLQ
jgi:hypothetical protein